MPMLRFVAGLLGAWCLTGIVLAVLSLVVPEALAEGVLSQSRDVLVKVVSFVYRNLRASIVPFVVVLAVYVAQFRHLRTLLADTNADMGSVMRAEQTLDLCASLFFGIGVIWTAIGMRDALLFALGDAGMAVSQGAFDVLRRLVDGGILLALSTTIVGGVGGYLMRTVKSLLLGEQLMALYMEQTQQHERDTLLSLRRIERSISDLQSSGHEV